jgi:hypothetical protein
LSGSKIAGQDYPPHKESCWLNPLTAAGSWSFAMVEGGS